MNCNNFHPVTLFNIYINYFCLFNFIINKIKKIYKKFEFFMII